MAPPALPYSADMLFCSMRNSPIASTVGCTSWPPNTGGVMEVPSRRLSSLRGRLPLMRTLPEFPQAPTPPFPVPLAQGILVQVNAMPKVDLTLSVGLASETIEVTAENTPILQTQQTDLGQTIGSRELEQLPTQSGSGRSPYNFLVLAAGVSQQTGCTGSGTGHGGVGAWGNSGNVRIRGRRPRNDDNLLDGTSITAPVFGGQDVQPTVEAIGEFRIEQNSMSAEYGKAGGAIVIAETKSGTNNFHGSGYEYVRNQKLDAKDYFVDPGKP